MGLTVLTANDARRVRVFEAGKFGTTPENLRRMLVGGVLTHPELRRLLERDFWRRLDGGTQCTLMSSSTISSTAFGKPNDGEPLKDVFTWEDRDKTRWCIPTKTTLVVPREVIAPHGGKPGLGVAANLTPGNCEISVSEDNSEASIRVVKPECVVIMELVAIGTAGEANDSTLFVPAKHVNDGKPSFQLISLIPECEVAGLLGVAGADFVRIASSLLRPWRMLVEHDVEELVVELLEVLKRPEPTWTKNERAKIRLLGEIANSVR